MKASRTATTAKELPVEQRKARLGLLVTGGEVSPEAADKVRFHGTSEKARQFAKTLAPRAKEFLGKARRAA